MQGDHWALRGLDGIEDREVRERLKGIQQTTLKTDEVIEAAKEGIKVRRAWVDLCVQLKTQFQTERAALNAGIEKDPKADPELVKAKIAQMGRVIEMVEKVLSDTQLELVRIPARIEGLETSVKLAKVEFLRVQAIHERETRMEAEQALRNAEREKPPKVKLKRKRKPAKVPPPKRANAKNT